MTERLEEVKDVLESVKRDLERADSRWWNFDTQDIEELVSTVEELEKQSHGIELNLLNDEVVRLEKQNQRYKQALEFYANEKNYERAYDDEVLFDYLPSEIDFDNGEKARQALEGEE